MPRISFTGKETMVMQGRCVGVDRVGGGGGMEDRMRKRCLRQKGS